MLKILRNKRAQSTLEYAMVIGVVVAALVVMQLYMRRGVQGKVRSSIESIGEQFDPDNVDAIMHYRSTSYSNELVSGGTVTSNVDAYDDILQGSYYDVGRQQ